MGVYFRDRVGITIDGRAKTDFMPDMSLRDVIATVGEPYRRLRTSHGRLLMYLLDMTGHSDRERDNLSRPLLIYIEKNRLSKIEDWTSGVTITVVMDETTRKRQFMITKNNTK